MQDTAEALPDALRPMHARLVGLHRRLQRMQQQRDHTLQEVVPLQAELDEVDAERWGSRPGPGAVMPWHGLVMG